VSDEEEWRPVVGYEGLYEVSSHGRVISMNFQGKSDAIGMMKPQYSLDGYPRFGLRKDSKRTFFYGHRLVLEAFVGPRPDGMTACHGNGIPDDNTISNLRWDTRKSNEADKERHGTRCRGETHGQAKLTEVQTRDIVKLAKVGVTHRQLAEVYGVHQSQIHSILSGKTWGHITGLRKAA
jgi:hypothetical protein